MKEMNETPEKQEISAQAYMIRFVVTLSLAVAVGSGYFFRDSIVGLFNGGADDQSVESASIKGGKESKKRKIKFWRAPMNPSYISSKPGKSPMGMDLVPVYEDEGGSSGIVRIDPAVVQNIGVRTSLARRGSLKKKIRTIGIVSYDETKLFKIQTKVDGWIEKLYVNATGLDVTNGTILLEIYSPDLVTTQEEYILALEYRNRLKKGGRSSIIEGGERLLESSRRRLEFFDVPSHQIDELAKTRKVKKTLHVHSPADGVVVKKNVIEGMFVKPGFTLYEIADLSRVWVYVDVFEFEAPYVKTGQKAVMTFISLPGRRFEGLVTYIYPFLQRKTRTLRLRLEFDNKSMELKPDMYGDVILSAGGMDDVVIIPVEAVIKTGERRVVFVDKGEGRFEPREVTLGVESEGDVAILSGVREKERVVTSAQFLIDSESKLREVMNKMTPPADPAEKKSDMESQKMDMGGTNKSPKEPMKMDHTGHR